jgi:hypothetical protein
MFVLSQADLKKCAPAPQVTRALLESKHHPAAQGEPRNVYRGQECERQELGQAELQQVQGEHRERRVAATTDQPGLHSAQLLDQAKRIS